MSDLLRAMVVCSGGVVVGLGTRVLWEASRLWGTRGEQHGARSAFLLMIVNILAMTYIALTFHWNDPITWRLPFAAVVFGLKALLMREVFFIVRRDREEAGA